MYSLGCDYLTEDWRLFIDSKISLKGELLHNGNRYPSIPIAYAIHIKGVLLHNGNRYPSIPIAHAIHMKDIWKYANFA